MDIPRKLSRPRKSASRCRITIVPRDWLLASLSADEKEKKREREGGEEEEKSLFSCRESSSI